MVVRFSEGLQLALRFHHRPDTDEVLTLHSSADTSGAKNGIYCILFMYRYLFLNDWWSRNKYGVISPHPHWSPSYPGSLYIDRKMVTSSLCSASWRPLDLGPVIIWCQHPGTRAGQSKATCSPRLTQIRLLVIWSSAPTVLVTTKLSSVTCMVQCCFKQVNHFSWVHLLIYISVCCLREAFN